ncbi:uncharacterized protein LOC100571443 isoform X1 [Acyrthosiphon pisum]|uniref:Pacifastin domain-containing protein n=1 Tax=Acyrthosiphon pisum TaxID=7029 RepID=A0A8R2JQG0_ACYPI|nr:uncharacterized protein LOC100571443 isoform X1 [Acyrthosiphon pisum]
MRVGGRTFCQLQLLLIVVFSAATSVHCLRNVKPDGPCDPGELVFVGFCNLCMCNSQGMPNQLCARSWCPVQTTLPPRNSILYSIPNKPFT